MIKAIIIDDELNSVFTLKSLLAEYCKDVQIAGSANNAKSGKELIASVRPQLLFLDIEMPLGSGFELLQSLPAIEFEIIFVTAYNQHALKAFRFSAIDYLVKPVRIAQLTEAVEKVTNRIKEKTASRDYSLLLRNMDEENPAKQKLAFTERGQQFLVAMEEIMYLLADGNYTHVHTKGKIFLSTRNLKDFEEALPSGMFYRVHNTHILNLNFIARVQKGRVGIITMKDGKTLELAARRKEAFMKLYRPM